MVSRKDRALIRREGIIAFIPGEVEKKEDFAILVDWGKKTRDKFMSIFFMSTCDELDSQRASTTQQVIFTSQLFYRPTANSGIIDQILGST